MNCYKCGASMPDDAKFCTNCGADLIVEQPGNNTNQGYNQNTNQGYNTYNGRQEPYLAGKDKTLIALLCFFFGGLGVHCFVMGETKKGVIRILFSLLCGIGTIFALVDFIMILTDTYVVNPDAYFFK